jgi:NAD dependent epimerase/dehydratase family enzyme
MKNRIILAGGSGFIGRLLLSKGYEVVVLTFRRFQRGRTESGAECRIHARVAPCAASAVESAGARFRGKMGACLIGTDAALALTDQRCVPKHFLKSSFKFEFPELRPALANIFSNS